METILKETILKERKLFKESHLFKKIIVTDIHLEEIVLHSPDIDRLSKFYTSLLNIGLEVEEMKSKVEEKRYQSRRFYVGKLNNGLSLRLLPTTREITPTPSLCFAVEDFALVLQRVKEYINDDVKAFSYGIGYGIGIHDPDGRAILLRSPAQIR